MIETVEAPPAPPVQPPQALLRPSALPPQARWLADDVAADDPLVATADTDALRELMRSVRQWTSSAPTVIEQPDETGPAEPAAVAESESPPTSVSIGNVTITVEDAPPAAPTRAARSTSTTSASDRLTRGYIRGG